MNEILQLLQLPLWMKLTATLIASGVSFAPTILELWKSTLPSWRTYEREKRRLEIMKLWMEVRMLRTQSGLDLPELSLPSVLRAPAVPGPTEAAAVRMRSGPFETIGSRAQAALLALFLGLTAYGTFQLTKMARELFPHMGSLVFAGSSSKAQQIVYSWAAYDRL